jgi:hypothetical protein
LSHIFSSFCSDYFGDWSLKLFVWAGLKPPFSWSELPK